MLLLEAGIAAGAKLIPALIPGLVASATGYVVIIGFGDWGGINEAGLSVARAAGCTQEPASETCYWRSALG